MLESKLDRIERVWRMIDRCIAIALESKLDRIESETIKINHQNQTS